MEPQESYNRHGGQNPERWIPALVLIGIGTLFFLNNLHILYIRDIFRYWPVVLIAGGIFKLVDSPYTNSRLAGGILIVVGSLFLASNLGFFYFSWNQLWPLALIAAGLFLLLNRLSGPDGTFAHRAAHMSTGSLDEAAIFGGGKRIIVDPNFTGGKVDAVFGGYEIDLRGASIAGDSAMLEINAIFGGAEVKIPGTWNADVRGTGIFGGYADSTRHPSPNEVVRPKLLIIKGSAIFGGVEVKN